MKRILFLILCMGLFGAGARAQNTIVDATVVDPNGLPYQAGFGSDSIQCTGNAQPYLNGSPLTRTIPIPALDGNGHFQVSLWSTTGLTDTNGNPLACQWRISITDHCQVATFSTLLTGITGPGPVDVSSQINAAAVPLSAACTPPGIVHSVTLGNLPPLFTVTVTGNPLNPDFTFNLSAAAANTVFGNCTGSTGLPSFCSITPGMLPGTIGTVSSFSSGNLVPLFDTSVANPTSTPAQSFTALPAAANTALMGPSGGDTDTSAPGTGNSASITQTLTPTTTAEAAIFIGSVANSSQSTNLAISGGGWTTFDTTMTYGVFAHAITSLSPFTATIPITSAQWTSTLILFGSNTGTPTVAHQSNICSGGFGSGQQTCSAAYSASLTGGNGVLVLLTSAGGGNISAVSASDTLFNRFNLLQTVNGVGVKQSVFYAANIKGGAGTFTIKWTDSAVITATEIEVYEIAGLNLVSAPYVFRPLVGLDLPTPGTGTLGGIAAAPKIASEWIDAINPDGTVHQSAVTPADISGLGFTQAQAFTFCASGCTVTGTPCSTTSGANDECTNPITWPTPFADTGYAVVCSGAGTITGFPFIPFVAKTSASVVTVTTSNGQGSAAMLSNFTEIDCQGIHP